jgi:hypothetical protein
LTETTAFVCPACGKILDIKDANSYPEHVKGDQGNAPHTLHVLDLKGKAVHVRGQEPVFVPESNLSPAKQVKMMDLPYIGRVATEPFIIWTFLMILFGILLGARII